MSLEKRLRNLFQVPRKGETYELRAGLVSQYAWERKDAIQRVISAMTVGKDVSALFPDVLKNVATHDLEQKKLVYLYLMNYAQSHPELCILAVNTFVQDSEDHNPLVRALAIRTMGCIRVDKIVDYMEIPLRRTIKDDNPYVRKTAAICVAKLYDLNPEMCVEEGFLDQLKALLDDSNPMVVANAVSALSEIEQMGCPNCIIITSPILNKLLLALNECTEWGRVAILSALAKYTAETPEEAKYICDRVVPQFQHANATVVLAAVKVVIANLDFVSKEESDVLKKKMGPPLVSLVSTPPEVQYVGLRNIRIVLEKFPSLLSKEIRIFYCKYNDPPYLKLEKLEILIMLASDYNISTLLNELKEYAMEVDTEFVCRAIRAIGQCAIKLESGVQKAIDILLELFATKISYVVNETTVVLRDIIRRYRKFEDIIIPQLCDSFDMLDDPEAKAALVWIVGDYVSKIPNIESILETCANSYLDEPLVVQRQILTAVVKVYLKKGTPEVQKILQKVLDATTQESVNADLRDRAFIYWRLLSVDTKVAKVIAGTKLPKISGTVSEFSPALLEELIQELSLISSVYHKPAASFISSGQKVAVSSVAGISDLAKKAKKEIVSNAVFGETLLDFDDGGKVAEEVAANSTGNVLDELNDLFGSGSTSTPQASTGKGTNADILNLFGDTTTQKTSSNSFDLLGGAGSLNTSSSTATPGAASTNKASNDLLDLF